MTLNKPGMKEEVWYRREFEDAVETETKVEDVRKRTK
jgi:hypothetical protein